MWLLVFASLCTKLCLWKSFVAIFAIQNNSFANRGVLLPVILEHLPITMMKSDE
jgi:hypothetical protein